MNKKYCIFAAQFLPHMGGIENYTYNISKELIKRGNEVIIITNNTTGSPLQEKIDGIRVLRFPCYNLINGRFPVMKLNKDFWKIHLNYFCSFSYNANSCANSFILIDDLETATVKTNMIINEKQNPKKNSILIGLTIPSLCANQVINCGKQSNTKIPTPTISHASAYRSSNFLFLIIFIITHNANITAIPIII